MSSSSQSIGITVGDPFGVGPEITLLSIQNLPLQPIPLMIYCDASIIEQVLKQYNMNLCLKGDKLVEKGEKKAKAHVAKFEHLKTWTPGVKSLESAKAAYDYLSRAVQDCMSEKLIGLVNGPLDKSQISQLGHEFFGHTYFLEKAFQKSITMAFLGKFYHLALATHHIPLSKVPENITTPLLVRTFHDFWNFLRSIGYSDPRVAVCGLNPHAGENGLLGKEEEIIKAAIQESKLPLTGPLASDTVFFHSKEKKYDGVISMYHDQGLAPFKQLHFYDGVQVSLGLPIIRTSVDHGTAFDLAGKRKANFESMKNAILAAVQFVKHNISK